MSEYNTKWLAGKDLQYSSCTIMSILNFTVYRQTTRNTLLPWRIASLTRCFFNNPVAPKFQEGNKDLVATHVGRGKDSLDAVHSDNGVAEVVPFFGPFKMKLLLLVIVWYLGTHTGSVPGDTHRHQGLVPGDTHRHQGLVPGDTHRHQKLVPGDTHRHQGLVPGDTHRHQGSVPGDTLRHQGLVPGDTHRHQGSVPGDTLRHQGLVPGDTHRHQGSVPGDTLRHQGLVPGDTHRHQGLVPGDTHRHQGLGRGNGLHKQCTCFLLPFC